MQRRTITRVGSSALFAVTDNRVSYRRSMGRDEITLLLDADWLAASRAIHRFGLFLSLPLRVNVGLNPGRLSGEAVNKAPNYDWPTNSINLSDN